VDQWRARLGTEQSFRIGLVWAGDPLHENDKNRSCALRALAPLAEVEGVSLVSLQVGDTARAQLNHVPPGMTIYDAGGQFADFADTAALMEVLDLIITVDFPRGGFSPPEGRLARGCKPPAFSRFLFQSAVQSAESF